MGGGSMEEKKELQELLERLDESNRQQANTPGGSVSCLWRRRFAV